MQPLVSHLPYVRSSASSIESYGQGMVGKTFRQIFENSPTSSNYGNPKRKGGLGNLLEECYFFFKANSDSEPDIPDAGVEIKSTPMEYKADGKTVKAGERLVLTMIPNDSEIDVFFDSSHLWRKCQLILMIVYHRNRALLDNLDYVIKHVKLFTPNEADLEIIHEDYLYIVDKVRRGRAHELSEADTHYLGACTKGTTASLSLKPQYYPCDKDSQYYLAKRRAFCYKTSYMSYVLNHYVISDAKYTPLDSIVKDACVLHESSFEDTVVSLAKSYVGLSCAQIATLLDIKYNASHPPKNFWSVVAMRMLGVRSRNAAEFDKAGIEVKAIRLEANNTIEQNMSFAALHLKELAADEWEESEVYNRFAGTRFLFVVFKRKGCDYYFKGLQFWNMPHVILSGEVYEGWRRMHDVLRTGVILRKTGGFSKSGNPIILNNLPGESDNSVIHLRPHATKAYYKLKDGTEFGNVSDGDQLPSGEWMTKQCLWLNKAFVVNQLDAPLKS